MSNIPPEIAPFFSSDPLEFINFIATHPEETQIIIDSMSPTDAKWWRRKIGQLAKAENLVGRRLESQGWRMWLQTVGSETFTKTFGFFHEEFFEWYWNVTLKRRRGERLSVEDLIGLVIWGRGSGKSSCVEWSCILEGALLGKGYVLYICGTEAQSKDHLLAIKSRLESSQIAKYYPSLAKPEIGAHGFRRGWSQEYLATKSGWGIVPAGLDTGIRGGRKDDMRFSLIVADDIDDFADSPEMSAKKLNTLARSVAPAGTEDTLILFPQNLIHENSVLNQIYTRRSDVFSVRRTFGPYPSFKNLELELKPTEDGARIWDIKSAEPNWEGMDVVSARKFLAKSGRLAFLAEYQHDFETAREGRVLRNYDDRLMVIRKSDFIRVFGSWSAIDHFNKWVGHDWARTKSQYHACVATKLAVSSQNTPLPGKLFLYDMMSFAGGTQADDVGRRLLNSISSGPRRNQFDESTWEELIEASVSRLNLGRYITDMTRLITARREVLAALIPPLVTPVLQRLHYVGFVGSHEQNNDALQVYRTVYGLGFNPCNPKETGGLEWADHYMMADKATPHPFFDDTQLADGSWEKGCPGMFLIVDDDKYEYPAATSSDHLHDSDLWRFQFTHWRMRPPTLTAAGEIEHGPMKMHDDAGNTLMMLLFNNPIVNAPLTYAETLMEALPARHQELVRTAEQGMSPENELALVLQYQHTKAQLKPQRQKFDIYGNLI